MKNLNISFLKSLSIILLLVFLFFFFYSKRNPKMDYWSCQRKGANNFNQTPDKGWFVAAKKIGIEWVRLAPDKWRSERRDFLIGDADHFTELSSIDLKKLKSVLDFAHKNQIKVVLTLLSLPGSRWKQNNHGKDDLRLWEQQTYRDQAVLCWKRLAKELKDHPALVGYNILNEPHPEVLSHFTDYRQLDFEIWYSSVKESLADLNSFYSDVIKAIREEDPYTPVIVDTGLYATPWAIRYLTPINDPYVLYSFHMYEPFAYTSRKINNGRFTYPGNMPFNLDEALSKSTSKLSSRLWNRSSLESFFHPLFKWQKKYAIPSSQILVGEFGCSRTAQGVEKYFEDLIEIFNKQGWHWAFYSFREDSWDGMDYELGSGKIPEAYWESAKNGQSLDPFRKSTPLFEVIKQALAAP